MRGGGRKGELLVHCSPSLHQPTRTRPARGLRDQMRGLGGGGWGNREVGWWEEAGGETRKHDTQQKAHTPYVTITTEHPLPSPTYANPSPRATAGSYA